MSFPILMEEANDTCSICRDTLQNPVSLPCGHNFCGTCLGDYKKTLQDSVLPCPMCTAAVEFSTLRTNVLLAEKLFPGGKNKSIVFSHMKKPRPTVSQEHTRSLFFVRILHMVVGFFGVASIALFTVSSFVEPPDFRVVIALVAMPSLGTVGRCVSLFVVMFLRGTSYELMLSGLLFICKSSFGAMRSLDVCRDGINARI
jgi:hypothetical protein